MKNLIRRLIPTGIAIAGLALAACQPFHYSNPPVILIPALNRVYEGEKYNYQMQVSGKRPLKSSIKLTPLDSSAPEWPVPLSIDSNLFVTGCLPQVDKDTDYNVEIDLSNDYGTAEQDFILHVLNVRHP